MTLPVFTLQTAHAAWRLDGATLADDEAGGLTFEFQSPGRSRVILKAVAPLRIVNQTGLEARLQPGWDGTLGYSLYGLEVSATATGTGRVQLATEPAPVPLTASEFGAALAARPSRFPDAPAAFRRWQADYRARLAARLMNGGLPGRVPLAPEVTSVEERTEFTLRRVSYQTHANRRNTLLLSVPRNVGDRTPLLVALHGHEAPWGEADAGAFTAGHADDFCAHFAERGWAVVQPATMDHTRQHPGWTLQGEWTWDAMVALDYALAQPGIAAGQVAVCGLSTGAHLAMNLLALDDRVQAGVVGCILSPWHHYRTRLRMPPHCDCGILGQLGDWLEPCDWAALASPKPVLFQHGRQDAAFCPGADPAGLQPGWNTAVLPEAEFALLFAEVERAWRLGGAPAAVALHIHAEGHRVDAEVARTFLADAPAGRRSCVRSCVESRRRDD